MPLTLLCFLEENLCNEDHVHGGVGQLLNQALHDLQVGEAMKKMPGSTGANPYAQMVEDAEGLDKIEALQVISLFEA